MFPEGAITATIKIAFGGHIVRPGRSYTCLTRGKAYCPTDRGTRRIDTFSPRDSPVDHRHGFAPTRVAVV